MSGPACSASGEAAGSRAPRSTPRFTPQALFEAMAARWTATVARHPGRPRTFDVRLGTSHVRWRILGDDLATHLSAAFHHLMLPPGQAAATPDLTIRLWDESATGSRIGAWELVDPEMESAHFSDGWISRCGSGRMHVYQTPRAVSLLDLKSARIFGAIGDFRALSLFDLSKPLLPLLFGWQISRGVLPAHAGCVALGATGWLIGGPNGAGKSTTSLAAGLAGMHFLADDYVLLTQAPGGDFTAHSLFAHAWLEHDHSRLRLPGVAALPAPGTLREEMKRPFDTARALAGRLSVSTPVTGLLLPRQSGGARTVWRPAGKGEALRRLAPSSVLPLPLVPTGYALAFLTRLVARLPCYWLDVSSDVEEIGAAVLAGPEVRA